jgi:hypothetical protein
MPQQDNESAHADWLAESQRTAQTSAMIWAERAEEAYETAIRHEDRAASWTPGPRHAEVIEEERKQAQIHGVRSTEARHLAEMWARVTAVLVPPPAPLELITAELRSTDD